MIECEHCNKTLKSKSGYTIHLKSCKSKDKEKVSNNHPMMDAILEFEKARRNSK